MSQTKDIPIGTKFSKLTVIGGSVGGEKIGRKSKRLHVLCKCECGIEKYVNKSSLVAGGTKSCGCLLGPPKRLEDWIVCRNEVIRSYKYSAFKKNHAWGLVTDEVNNLFSGDCYYCGIPPSKIKMLPKYVGIFTYNGIDRLNNDNGYFLENCVSCCEPCNRKKSETHVTDFLMHINKIANHLGIIE